MSKVITNQKIYILLLNKFGEFFSYGKFKSRYRDKGNSGGEFGHFSFLRMCAAVFFAIKS